MGLDWEDLLCEGATLDDIDDNAVNYFLTQAIEEGRLDPERLNSTKDEVLANLGVIKDVPSIYCSYGDMATLQNFMFWMNPIELDSNGCSFDTQKLKDEFDYCAFHRQDVIDSIEEEYANDKSYARDLIDLFSQYTELLKFALERGHGLRWG